MKKPHLYGNRKKLFSGLWILAGCFFIGLNGYGFMALLDDPLPEPSREVIMARSGFQSFQDALSKRVEIKDSEAWALLKRKFSRVKEKVAQKVPLSEAQGVEENLPEPKELPPVLSGILSFTNPKGKKGYLAIIDGVTLGEKEQMNGIVVAKIDESGVTIRRGGSEWFINAPDVGFSMSR